MYICTHPSSLARRMPGTSSRRGSLTQGGCLDGVPVPPNPSWLRTHTQTGWAPHDHPLPHLPSFPAWLLHPCLVLLFSSWVPLPGPPLPKAFSSFHLFGRWGMRQPPGIIPREEWQQGFSWPGGLWWRHIVLCPPRPHAPAMAAHGEGWGLGRWCGKQQWARLSPGLLLRLGVVSKPAGLLLLPRTPRVLARTGSGSNGFGQPRADFRWGQKPQA